MNIIPVCPPEPGLLQKLSGRKVVLHITADESIDDAVAMTRQNNIHLHCLIIESKIPVVDFVFLKECGYIPIALFAPALGRFRRWLPTLAVLKNLNINVYLPLDRDENFTNIRILSSLGIATTAVLDNEDVDWGKVSDLMTYALLGKVPRASINPFVYLAQRYSPEVRNDFSAVYFDDPSRYVHLSSDGCIALTSQELSMHDYVASSVDDLDRLPENMAYLDRLDSWRSFFREESGCAYCESWRICLGKFSEKGPSSRECVGFFREFWDAIEIYQSQNLRKFELWQP